MIIQKHGLTPAIEDYLEAIYLLDTEQKGVRSIDVATNLSVSKPSVNKAIHNLCLSGLATQAKYSLIHLTDKGREKAREVINRHCTIKEFLLNVLRVSEQTAEQEACLIEHAMSNETVSKMRDFLTKHSKK